MGLEDPDRFVALQVGSELECQLVAPPGDVDREISGDDV
jgi:hypothetical protein